MPKRIVICSDGTGNTAVKGRGTNVFKLFEAVDLDGHRSDPTLTPQIALYDDGVGTQEFGFLKLLAGATGWGLSRSVKHLYKELARIYDPGDQIYMFGFSRGAFTVRTLAGLIATCGIVNPDKLASNTFAGLESAIDAAYSAYRRNYRPALWRWLAPTDRQVAATFRRRRAHDYDVTIRFMGVWDTVDAVGLPFFLSDLINAVVYRFKFNNLELTPKVERACQALAIDEERESRSASRSGRSCGARTPTIGTASSRSGLPARIRTSAADIPNRACRWWRWTGCSRTRNVRACISARTVCA
jgi:uncharacterized protein (DUF2235 family)